MKLTIHPQTDAASHPANSQGPYRESVHWQPEPGVESEADPVVKVFVTQKAYVRICAHSSSDLNNEVGGWMLGKKRHDKKSGEDFIVIDTILPAQHTVHGSAFLTFTRETQLALLDTMQQDYPHKELVGWFHTHPRMGVFLSNYDTFLHQNFFPEIWQVALVVEPFSQTGGFFIRQADGRLDARGYHGFYEILGNKKRSVVHWRNLSIRLAEEIEGELHE